MVYNDEFPRKSNYFFSFLVRLSRFIINGTIVLGRRFEPESQTTNDKSGAKLRESEKRRRTCQTTTSNVGGGENHSGQSIFSKENLSKLIA